MSEANPSTSLRTSAVALAGGAKLFELGFQPVRASLSQHDGFSLVLEAGFGRGLYEPIDRVIQEDMLADVSWRWEVVQSQLTTQDGYWQKTDVPGLGIEVDEQAAQKYPFKPEIIHANTVRAHDGAILDW